MPGLGSLTVYLNANSGGLERGIARAEKLLKQFAAASAGYFAVSGIKQLAQESLNLAGVQQRAENLMARTLQNTAGMAEFTVGELKRYASEAQSISIFGDEKVLEAQTRLMQMNSVTGDAFRQTRAVALDIASATGQDLTAVMQNLGKAMQDPVKGIRQLREYGTDPALKDQIEQVVAAQGREAAQLILLTDLQQRYQGAAEEAANTISGAFAQNRNALGDLKESFGFLLNEIFGVQDLLKTTANWFGSWASYLRDHAAEIGYAFRSVWNDVKFGAQKLYLFVAPVINQIASIAEAAARNIIEFYQAIPRLLNGEDFQLKLYTPIYNLLKEYEQFGEKFDQLTRDQASAQSAIDREFSLKMSKQAEQNIARGAAAGTENGMQKAIKKQQKHRFDAPAAIEGSADAWKIITDAMQWKPGKNAPVQVSQPAAPASIASARPAGQTAAASPEAKRMSPIAPMGPIGPITPAGHPSVRLFEPQVTATQISSRDLLQSIRDMATILNPVTAAAAMFKPQSYRTAYDIATAPQAQQENIGTRALMAVTSFFDDRNNGARFAADAASPITREQVQAERARRQQPQQTFSDRAISAVNSLWSGLKQFAGIAPAPAPVIQTPAPVKLDTRALLQEVKSIKSEVGQIDLSQLDRPAPDAPVPAPAVPSASPAPSAMSVKSVMSAPDGETANDVQPLLKEQVKLATQQLTATRETNRMLRDINLQPANLFGGF